LFLLHAILEFGIDRTQEFPNVEAWAARIQALPRWKHPYELMPGTPAK
jgi:glutathione S-transferase